MPVTLFWSRFRDDLDDEGLAEYQEDSARIRSLAENAPGFVSFKTYVAEDGERLSVVMFESEEEQQAFRALAEHRAAQQRGRERYYQTYRIMVCQPLRAYEWPGDEGLETARTKQ
jgi:heme-degrading monooxygenase HmoA